MQQKTDNYQILAAKTREKFLTYDQQSIISSIPMTHDDRFFYLPVLDRTCRICRKTGMLAWSCPDGSFLVSAEPCDYLTVFDYLCDADPCRSLSDTFVAMANFGHMFHSDLLEDHRPSKLEQAIDRHPELLRQACRALHGTPVTQGDIGYKIPFFPDMPVVLRFWHSDEDFPAQLRYFWDKNALFYLKYETMFYALGILQNRLLSFINC